MSNVRVAVRVRPLTKREEGQGAKVIVGIERDRLLVTNLKVPVNKEHDSRARTRQFGFDFCYWSADVKSQNFATQEMIYEDIGSKVLEAVFEGFNACVLAYGQSGSGKTFTMMGQNGDLGLTPRICQGLFDRLMKVTDKQLTFRTEVSFLEIYNERVGDLLRPPISNKQLRRRPTLRVREHPKLGPCVQDLSKHVVTDFNGVQTLIERGLQNRSVAATRMHDHSSRSHAIFTINFIQARLNEDLPSEVVSKIHLVDLAGSERATVGMNKIRLKEGANINKSLVALGSVICALAEKSISLWSLDSLSSAKSHTSSTGDSFSSSSHRGQPPFVPYRDSVLTWLLKDSLGGNSKTIMVATISPASTAYNETLSTLRYAQRAKCIVNKPIINEDPNVKLIRELKAEIARLRELLSTTKQNGILEITEENSLPVSEIITRNQDKAQELTRCWIEKWHYFQRQAQETVCNTCSSKANMSAMIDCSLLESLNLFSDGVQLVCLKDSDTVANCHLNAESDEIGCLSLASSDTSKCKLCDSDMLSDENDDQNGPILKSLLSDSDDSSKSELEFDKNSILPNICTKDVIESSQSRGVRLRSIVEPVTNDGFDDDDDWSDTDDFSFYAFDDEHEESNVTPSSVDVSQELRNPVRYLSPIEECPSSQSQSPIMLTDKVDDEMTQCGNEQAEHSKNIEPDYVQDLIDIDSDSLNDSESEKVPLTVENCDPEHAEKQHRISQSQETGSNIVSGNTRRFSCYHIGFVSSDNISDMDTDFDAVSFSMKPHEISRNVSIRRTSLDTRSKKQYYYTVNSSRNNCGSSSSSDDDTSHSHNSAHLGNKFHTKRPEQRFQRIVMENKRKRRRKKTPVKKESSSKSCVYRNHSRSTSLRHPSKESQEKYSHAEKTVSPLPLPRPVWKQHETHSSSKQPILKSLLNDEFADSAVEQVHKITKMFDKTEKKDGSSTLLDCCFTADSLENLSSRCPSQNGQNPAEASNFWNYMYEKVEPSIEHSTLKKHTRRSAFKHSWPSCDSLTMVYMGPEWGSTETNLVASIQSLDDQDWFSSDMVSTQTKNVFKKSFSDSCLLRKWADVASSSLFVPEVPLTLSQPEMILRDYDSNHQCRLLSDHDPREVLPQKQTTSKIMSQTIPTTEMTLNEKDKNLLPCIGGGHTKSGGGDCSQDVATVKEPWNGHERYSDGVWMPLSTFYMNNYQADHLDDDQDGLSFCEESRFKTEKQSVCTIGVVSTKTESSSDSGFQTEIATNHTILLENSSSQTPKVTRESFSQTSKFLSDTSVQTDPICLVMSTQTDPVLVENGSQTENRVSECIQTVTLHQQRDGFSQTNFVSCKDVSMQTSTDFASFEDASQNELIDSFPVSESSNESSEGNECADEDDSIDSIRNNSNCCPVADSNTSLCGDGGDQASENMVKLKDLKAYDSGIYIGFHGKHRVQSLSIRFNSDKLKCSSSDEANRIASSIGETADMMYLRDVGCSLEESSVCNQETSSCTNFHDEKEDIDVDCAVSDYSNDVTVSCPSAPSVVSPSKSSLSHQECNVSITPEMMDNDSCKEDHQEHLERTVLSNDVADVQQQHKSEKPVCCSNNSSVTKDEQNGLEEPYMVSGLSKCLDTTESSCTTFTQTENFNDIFQFNTLKAFLYSSIGTGQLDFAHLDFITEMGSRIKALEVQCSEILKQQQWFSIDYAKRMKKTERSRKKTVEWKHDQKLVTEFKKERGMDYDNDEDYYQLPNTLKLNGNYLHKRRKVSGSDSLQENSVVLEIQSNPLILTEDSTICPEETECFSQETPKTIDSFFPAPCVLYENATQVSKPTAKEVEKLCEDISTINSEVLKKVSTSECQLQKTHFEQDDSEEDYGSNIPEDILALLKECKAVRKKAWVEISLAHQQLGY